MIKLALRIVGGRSSGYENRGQLPALEGVTHHNVDKTPTLRPPSVRLRVRCTTQSSPCCLERHSEVWRPDASAKEHDSGSLNPRRVARKLPLGTTWSKHRPFVREWRVLMWFECLSIRKNQLISEFDILKHTFKSLG